MTEDGIMADTQVVRKKADNENTYVELPKGEVRVSVRNLVEFILRCGDIDNRRYGSPENAMQEGSRIHRKIQKQMGAEYQAEVFLRYTHETEKYVLVVEGRADGIIEVNGEVTIDEIKGTYRDLSKMREPVAVHAAQAKCYAYIYGLQKELKYIKVRLTYCNIETESIRYFYEDYTFEELENWFQSLITAYRKWADYSWEWRRIRQESIEGLQFPFPYRDGQKELVSHVYRTIYHKRKLFLEAPTGVGKTISTVFPAIKAMGMGMGDRIFYLTAKTITGTVADDTMALLRENGLRFKSVMLTAKEKICFMDRVECNPEHCPYAKGHFDRINDAIFDLLTSEESFTRERIEEYASKYQVCPFEMCLDLSLFADGIICDYNYLFDPHVYLKRFFGDGSNANYIFLIDEAHNLLERGREMYSATLVKEDFLRIKREIKQEMVSEMPKGHGDNEETVALPRRSILYKKGYGELLMQQLEKCNKELLEMKKQCAGYELIESIDVFVRRLMRLYSTVGEYLEEQEEVKLPVRDALLEFYFDISHFLDIYERVDENYVKYTQLCEDDSFLLKLFCVNPSKNLKECMARGRSSILFSATFLPIQYYKGLLGGEAEDYEVYAKSIFQPQKRRLFIAEDVTSKYTRRSEKEFYNIARYIHEVVKNRNGNYMVFCPSYYFMQTIYDVYLESFLGDEQECILQQEYMSEEEREAFLARFREKRGTLIAFCVMGGIFSEGIDLKEDSLIGAIIVGTGLPQVCPEREILKNYFDRIQENGFDYSYRYPGMNKVLQAAGRVIRTVADIGIVVLLDERFLQYSYRRMFPREWESYEIVSVDTIDKRVEYFWNSRL